MARKSLISAAVVLLVGSSAVGLVAASASAESRHWSHPEDQYGDPHADIRAYSLSLDPSSFRASIALAAFDLASAQSSTFVVELDTTGNGVADYNISKPDAASAEVRVGEAFTGERVTCPSASLAYSEPNKSLTFSADASCIGSPTSLRGSYYYSVAEGADFAPAPDRFSPAVSNQPDASPSPSASSSPPTDAPAGRSTGRLAGGDRYSTAVAISKNVFPNGAPIVFLARADAFADALAGGTLTRGPILLVPQCGPVPEVVKAEVRRLGAMEVVALGGPGAVCDAVLAAVADA